MRVLGINSVGSSCLSMILAALGTGSTDSLAKASEQSVHVSIKFVVNTKGQRLGRLYQTDDSVRDAIDEANAALLRVDAGWSMVIDEIVDLPSAAAWLEFDCFDKATLESEAETNPRRFAWRSDAINVYVLPLKSCGGVCSFPHNFDDIILINSDGIANGGIGWLHEVGHYLGLWHSFQCVYGYPRCDSHPAECTGAGGVDSDGYWVTCPDSCPSTTNIMSYFDRIHSGNAIFSPCQLEIIYEHLATDRANVVELDPNATTCVSAPCGAGGCQALMLSALGLLSLTLLPGGRNRNASGGIPLFPSNCKRKQAWINDLLPGS